MSGIKGRILILLVVPLILYVGLLPVMPLMEPDEGRYSAIPAYMNKTGDYITPHLKEAVYIEKPPLAYWVTALFFKMFGENEFASRLFAGLSAWGCILLVFLMGKALYDEKAGLFGAALLSVSLFHFAVGRINILDMPVTFFISLALWLCYRYYAEPEKKWRLHLSYLACALAFLTKGLIGVVFPLAIILIWLVAVKRWREIYRLVSPPGILIFLAVSLPWVVLIQRTHSDFLRFFFIQEHFQRYTTTIHHRNEPFYYYIPIVIAGTFPWSVFLFEALKGKGAKWAKAALQCGEGGVFLLSWAGFIFLFFSLSSSKLIPYIAPVFLPLAVFAGRIFSLYGKGERLADGGSLRRFLPAALQALLFIVSLMAPPFLKRGKVPFDQWWPWAVAPVMLIAILAFLPEYVKRKNGGRWFASLYIISALFLCAMVFPISRYLAPYKSALPVAEAINRYVPRGSEVYQFDVSLYGIDFYNGIRTPVVDDIGEVRYGAAFLPPAEQARYFLTADEFFRLYSSGLEMYCVTDRAEKVERLKEAAPGLTVLWENGNYYLLRLNKLQKG